MALPDVILVNGTSLGGLTGIIVNDMSGLLAPGRRRGDDLAVPGRAGVIATVGLPYDAYAFDVPITVLCEEAGGVIPATDQGRRAQMINNLRGVAALFTNPIVTLTRRQSLTASTTVDHTCSARFADGLQVALFNPVTGRTVLEFVNLDGCWYSGTTAVVP